MSRRDAVISMALVLVLVAILLFFQLRQGHLEQALPSGQVCPDGRVGDSGSARLHPEEPM
jgi:hypothetical protein